MHILSKKWPIAFLSCLFTLGPIAGDVYAQNDGQPEVSPVPVIESQVEAAAPSISLKKTWIKTEDGFLSLSPTFVDAFTPTTVSCQGTTARCTVRIEVSSQFWDLPAGEVIRMLVKVDGSEVGVEPDALVNVDSTTTGVLASVRTFSWMKKALSPGPHSIDVEFHVSSGNAAAGFRTLTIEVYKP